MTISSYAIFLLPILSALMFTQTRAQLLEEEVPAELQHLLHWDLDTWKPPQEISEKFPYYLSGFDADNRPIWVLEFGKWDIPTILARGSKWEKALDKHVDQWLWKMYDSIGMRSDPEDPVKEAVVIIDMDGYNLKQINSAKSVAFIIRKMRDITLTLRFAYGAYAINTNFFGQTLLNILRPIMGKDFEKLEVYGTNPARYRPILLRHIPRDQLAEWYGGVKGFKPLWVSG
ncbi:unnamed protein product [Allacma fusca]|uniref:CRAL-TRIO domain-containing protein n=1 Tax=Allacma fusca TaxID=39272 RepID=A0A8J2J4S8_9HEXA|nr:unnamed protein product [Allacma fusca]